MKITIAQLNPIVGDIRGNLSKLVKIWQKSSEEKSDLLITPELYLVGYPPRDLLEKHSLIRNTQMAINELTNISIKYPCTALLVGAPAPSSSKIKRLNNSAFLIHNGKVLIKQDKTLLPIYDVFDEARYFEPASDIDIVSYKGKKLGISICEDAWNNPQIWNEQHLYSVDPIEILANKGANLLINISASPFSIGKEEIRRELIGAHARKHGIPFIYVNQVGANDDLIFDGHSMYFDRNGKLLKTFLPFEEHIETIDLGSFFFAGNPPAISDIEAVYKALILGIKDYFRKCGFSRAVVGLSGGIDSAVTACLAQEALGRNNLLGISMPSPYSSQGSVADSKKLAYNLGIDFKVIPISQVYYSYLETLHEHFAGQKRDVTEENIQARIRGNILMAFSNKFGYLVLSTGNKSELAVGYCTLYGDMSGGLSVLADVPKTMVYELAGYINSRKELIPREILEKPPSAELSFNQLDQDTLPPYEVLDPILDLYIEKNLSADEITSRGFDPVTVHWVLRAVDKNEYKRRQAALGLKVTSRAFGIGRRMPIAAKYSI